MFTAPTDFYRLDPLTGCSNFLSFVETLSQLAARAEKQPFSILHADLNHLYMLNTSKGRAYGDTVIRWMEIVLREESRAPTYRIGGDQFSVILSTGTITDGKEVSDRIFARLNREGEHHLRRGQPKSGTDWRDIAMLLLAFPDLKTSDGLVAERLRAENAGVEVMKLWQELVAQEIQTTDEEDEF